MFKVSIHKDWEYVVHQECLNRGNFETADFKTCKEDLKSKYINGRYCIHCKSLIINKPPEERKFKKKINKVKVTKG